MVLKAPLKTIQVSSPWQLVSIDVTSPFVTTDVGKNKYIIIMIDYFSKYCIAKATCDYSAKTNILFDKLNN